MLNGDAHLLHSLRLSRRISRCLIFNYAMHMITEDEPSYHARALYRRLSARPYRILYVGLDHELMRYLEESMVECWLTRAPTGLIARLFIERLKHSLLLFDEILPDTTGESLACFTRSLAHREGTPIIIVKKFGDVQSLTQAILNILAE